jgi:HD domain
MVYEQIEKEKYSYNFKNFMNLSGAFFVLGRKNFSDLFKEVDKLMGVALFHDIRLRDHQGMILSLRALREAKLPSIEEEIILDHARDAAEILQGEKDFPLDMSKIIREHHGDISGLGFPFPPKESIGHLSKVFLATELFLKELYETKDTPDMERLQKSLKEDIYKKIINQLYLIFSGGK